MAAVLALSACGGGGGSGGTTEAAQPAAASPPDFSGTRVVLSQLPSPCQTSTCLPFATTTVNASGETFFFWQEAVPGTTSHLRTAEQAAGASSLLGTGDVASAYESAGVSARYAVRAITERRFVVWEADEAVPPNISPATTLHSRIVSFDGTSSSKISASTDVPSVLSISMGGNWPFPGTVRDHAGTLYALTDQLAAGSLVPLGEDVNLTVVATPDVPATNVEDSILVEYSESLAPRVLWGLRGTPKGGTERQVMLADMSLADTKQGLTSIVSKGSFSLAANGNACGMVPPMRVRASVSTAIYQVVAWTQLNAAATGCDLMVNGEKISGPKSVGQYELAISNSEVVAVWEECEIASCKLYWSRRPLSPTAVTSWTTPAPIAPAYVLPTDTQMVRVMTSGPNATLLVTWTNWQPTSPTSGSNDGTWRASKYVNGQWTTARFSQYDQIRALSINAAGQGSILTTRDTCGSSACEELAAFRF